MLDGSMWQRTVRGLLAVALLLALSHGAALVAAPRDAPASAVIEQLLRDGKAAEALDAAYAALARGADDLDLLQLASTAAESAERKDEALWLTHLALRTALVTDAKGPVQRSLATRVGALDPLPEPDRPALDGYAKELLELGALCLKRRLYANAVDFFQRCEDTAGAVAAAAEMEKLYKNKRAVTAMLASGIDVPLQAKQTKSARRIAMEDARHDTWKKAWKIKGDNYTVETDAGWELGSAVLDAMEQVNAYYRQVFQHKQGGGGTARCTIRLYKTREEFLQMEGERDDATQGFYSSANYVACFDPRSHGGRIGDLWETLFHEASHQFTSMISTGTIPGWLDEGTAVYFEGTRRQGNGRVVANLVEEERLDHLKDVLRKGSPTLREVVSWFRDESYPLDYYPIGGFLVYFFKNYEDDACERVYAPIFDAYLRSYKSGGKHDPVQRFEEYFIHKADQPGVKDFAAFEKRFKDWCLQLCDLQFGPTDRADVLLQRAAKQRKLGKLDAAIDSYRWALDKRNGDLRGLLGLAEVHAERKDDDASVYRFRQLIHEARSIEAQDDALAELPGLTPKALTESCLGRIEAVDGVVAQRVATGDAAYVAMIDMAARKYVEAGYPRVAAWLLDNANGAVAGHRELEAAQHAIESEHAVYARLWRRPPLDLEDWDPVGRWTVEGDALVGTYDAKGGDQACILREPLPDRYRFEVTIRLRKTVGEDPFVGLLFGIDEGPVWDVLGSDADGAVDVSRAVVDWKTLKDLPSLGASTKEPFRLGIDVERGRVRFFVQGKQVYTHTYPPGDTRGRVGFVVQDVEAEFTDIRMAW